MLANERARERQQHDHRPEVTKQIRMKSSLRAACVADKLNPARWSIATEKIPIQARSKRKMTRGGGDEQVAHINSPSPPLRSSDHYSCVQYLLQVLSLIFRLCWLWRNRELAWNIVRRKFAKQLLSVFFLPKLLATSTRVRASVLSLWTCNIIRWLSLESPVVERKYVFTRFKAENDLSLTALGHQFLNPW